MNQQEEALGIARAKLKIRYGTSCKIKMRLSRPCCLLLSCPPPRPPRSARRKPFGLLREAVGDRLPFLGALSFEIENGLERFDLAGCGVAIGGPLLCVGKLTLQPLDVALKNGEGNREWVTRSSRVRVTGSGGVREWGATGSLTVTVTGSSGMTVTVRGTRTSLPKLPFGRVSSVPRLIRLRIAVAVTPELARCAVDRAPFVVERRCRRLIVRHERPEWLGHGVTLTVRSP